MGQNLSCTFSNSTAGQSSTGTVYISGTMMRGDFTSQIKSSTNVQSHMIRSGDQIYVWSGAQGAKMAFAGLDASASTQSNGSVNLDQKVNYKCTPWTVDNGQFTPPTNVKFIDLSAMMKGAVKAK